MEKYRRKQQRYEKPESEKPKVRSLVLMGFGDGVEFGRAFYRVERKPDEIKEPKEKR